MAAREQKDEFLELYRAHFGYVWTTARRLGVRLGEVDDVVQETFLTAYRLLERYEARGAERGWLFSILYRVVQRHRRSAGRWSSLFKGGSDVEEIAAPPSAGPERSAETSKTVALLERVLDALEPERRAVLVLADLEGRTVNEIADILSINANTATSRLRAARAHVEAAVARHRARDGWRYK